MIGTPFISEDEITQRRVDKLNKKPWEQEVRDEKGRKRLHGAFTGGFSAGYFNTVGTKEGWTTSQFRSSRGDKTITATTNQSIKKQQDVMDFMDEEDIKDQIGDTAITSKATHKDYLTSLQPRKAGDEDQEALAEEAFKKSDFSNAAAASVKEFVPQFNNLIGAMLMRESGFEEAEFQRNAYKDNNCSNRGFFNNDFLIGSGSNKNADFAVNEKYKINDELDDNNKYYSGKLEFKDDYNGVGYISLIQDEVFGARKAKESLISGSAGNLNGNNKNIIRMDKFEDNEEFGFYTSSGATDKQKYNFEILDENYLNDKEKQLKRKRLRENMDTNFEMTAQKFLKSESKLHSVENMEFKMPVLPKDYDPFAADYTSENKELKNSYNIETEINKLTQSASANSNLNAADQRSSININDNKAKTHHQKLDANKRSEILDLELEIKPHSKLPDSYNPYLQSKFTKAEVCDFKTLHDNKLIYNPNENETNKASAAASKSAPSTFEQFNNYFHLKVDIPFKDDVSRIARFAKFVAEKEGLIMGDSTYNTKNNLMSGSESKAEREQFERLYAEELSLRKQEQLSKTEIKNPQLSESEQMKERIEKIKGREIKREKSIWVPEKILCKRFKVKDPFENKINSVVAGKADAKDADRDLLNVTFKKGEVKYTMSSLQYQLFKQEVPKFAAGVAGKGEGGAYKGGAAAAAAASGTGRDIKSANNESNVFKVMNAKTDVNLFDEIFKD